MEIDEQWELRTLAGNIPVNINIGAIELSLADVLSLRPGSMIRFERPRVLEATIKIGDRAWADVELEIESHSISVKVMNIVPLKETLI